MHLDDYNRILQTIQTINLSEIKLVGSLDDKYILLIKVKGVDDPCCAILIQAVSERK